MSEAGVSETFYRLFDSAPGERICVVLPDGGAIRFGAMAARSREHRRWLFPARRAPRRCHRRLDDKHAGMAPSLPRLRAPGRLGRGHQRPLPRPRGRRLAAAKLGAASCHRCVARQGFERRDFPHHRAERSSSRCAPSLSLERAIHRLGVPSRSWRSIA